MLRIVTRISLLTSLSRTVRLASATTAILLGSVVSVCAQAAEDTDHVEFAPGATGEIDAPIAGIVQDSKELGAELRERLKPQEAAEGAFADIDFEALRDRALSDPRVQALLGAEGEGLAEQAPEKERFEGARVFLLASFSMPQLSLRQMMEEAQAHNVPIVFRGFVNNSVYETRAAIEATFGTADESVGFSIDPTLFTRFEVTSVPQVIAVDESIDVCETSGCEGDPVPPHDVVRGNVPLRYALELIADQGEVGQQEAARILREAGHE